jgi:hypothetical protein
MTVRHLSSLAGLALSTAFLWGCAHSAPATPTVPPRPEDVATIDGVMKAYYDVVNVEPDGPRQWDRDRTLYSPWIHFVTVSTDKDGHSRVKKATHQEFVDAVEPALKLGFRETEIFRQVHQYGSIAHVESTYETYIGKTNPQKSRGVNYLELYYDGGRWWVASAVWQDEDAGHPIPPELLPR